jgi:hypothetical protein
LEINVMIGFLKNVAQAFFPDEEPQEPETEFVERRQMPRLGLRGREVPVRSSGIRGTLQLKDLSCGGVSGITGLPAAVGDRVGIELPVVGKRLAWVCWVKSTSMGLRFETPLSLMSVAKLYALHWDCARPFKLGGSLRRLTGTQIAINDDEKEMEPVSGASEVQI